jgi:hypothetical protein
MLSLVISYIFLISGLYFLPEKAWERAFTYKDKLFQLLKKVESHSKNKSRVSKARLFERYLVDLESRFIIGQFEGLRSVKNSTLQSPEYGFYTELVDKLLEKYRQMGLPLKEILRELKINLSLEIQFELKCESIAKNSYFQFLMMGVVTWGFVLFTNMMIELRLKIQDYLIILLLQICGAFIFVKFSKKLNQKHFKNFDDFIKKMYIFLTYLEVNASQSKAIIESEVLHLGELKDERFLPCAYRLEEAITKWKDLGLSPKGESKAILLEIWNLKEQTFHVFIRQFESLKFCVLAFFFLPAYFYYLYAIFQFFMEQ